MPARALLLACGLLLGCRTSAPAAAPEKYGSLEKHEIRQVVRSNLGDIAECYEQRGLARDGALTGRVMVRFIIGPGGAVTASEVLSSSLPAAFADVGACIAAATRTWKFPRPEGGGSVLVDYPFVLEPRVSLRSPSGLFDGDRAAGAWFPLADRPPRSLVVELVEPGGSAAANVQVKLDISTREQESSRVATTDARGRVEFLDLPEVGSATARLVDDPRTASVALMLSPAAMGTILVRKPPKQPEPTAPRRAAPGDRPPAPYQKAEVDPRCPLEGTWRGDDGGAEVSLRIFEKKLSASERAEYAPYRMLCVEQIAGPSLVPGASGPWSGCSLVNESWELRLREAEIDYLYEYERCPLRVRRSGASNIVLERASP